MERTLKAWEAGDAYTFTIESNTAQQLRLGRISIRKTKKPEVWHISYWTHPVHQRQGIMTEVVAAVITFAFEELMALRLESCYAIWNKASEKVLVNNGFVFLRHLEKGFLKQGEWVAENEVVLTREQWENNTPKPQSCSFCQVIQGNENTLFENEEVVAMLDIDPISLGHFIICPKQHYTDFHEMPDELIGKMMLLAKEYLVVMQKLFAPRGYSMMLNGGAFNDLKHVHLHVFPRNTPEEFQWTSSDQLHPDAKRIAVIKQFLAGYLPGTKGNTAAGQD